MGKNPAFQFYPSDWVRDLGDQPHEIAGAWVLILCSLFWDGGKQTKTISEWAKILRETKKKTEKILNYLKEKQIADFEFLDNQNITIISRRMVRDYKISQLRKEVGKLGGNPNLTKKLENLDNQTDNQKPTPSSSTSTSKNIYTSDFLNFYTAYPKKVAKVAAWKAWKKLNGTLPPVDTLIAKIQSMKTSNDWIKENGKYIPHPATWLSQKRWEDEGVQVEAKSTW